MSEPLAVRTVGLTRFFGERAAVADLALEVPAGAVCGLLGPNGAGKSTTVKMLTTLLAPTSGQAWVAGFDVTAESRDVRRRIGYVPQMLSADGGLTGEENLVLSARLYGMPRRERRERIAELVAFMGLTDSVRSLVRTYSGGMIRRLELAQALLHRPSVLFLDEPTIGLDPVARRAVWERLLERRRQGGLTILLTTHDMEEADALCDTLTLLHHGRVAASGSPADLKRGVGEGATLDDVFAHFASGAIDEGGTFRDVRHVRDVSRRLG